uniref:Granulins domain-containing protein n=1 Tax=Chrysotila carterae TaxID=13221 RepID=A0A7S4BJH3_CHRCT
MAHSEAMAEHTPPARRSMLALALALLIHVVRATVSSMAPSSPPQGCATGATLPMENCFQTRECCTDGFECFKKTGRDYAQCRNSASIMGWPAPTNCSDPEAGWTCPDEWVGCSDRWQGCAWSKCCVQEDFGCYKKVGSPVAICRPLREGCDSAEWSCPGTWEHCTDRFKDCIESKCCIDVRAAI